MSFFIYIVFFAWMEAREDAGGERTLFADMRYSASPLNGEAALLWDRDQEEFKKKVLARHVEPSELED